MLPADERVREVELVTSASSLRDASLREATHYVPLREHTYRSLINLTVDFTQVCNRHSPLFIPTLLRTYVGTFALRQSC
ncbi:hypothetical protein [Anabaena azotica]|uniref:Uncharacterized protein n=1 Tax=Anabaena azotica FACHB-119 TaxID=947527 RepID=A0ABR8D600_9NOST|nr:hypothetical protein [Anabaena azotica]MBD2501868.1 hypothetical protein [Anabaena azotica FACHB-119]